MLNRPFNEKLGVEFSLEFGPKDYGAGVNGVEAGLAYGQPILRRDMKVRIVEDISEFFGDVDTDNIILRVFDADNGIVVWHNKSLAHLPCDSKQIMWVKNQMIDR